MKPIQIELANLKKEINEMFTLVNSQLTKAGEALFAFDKELAREVYKREKRVNAVELKIDSLCENFIALFTPVAVDLRIVLAIMEMNNNLERIGDFAEGIARFVLKSNKTKIDEQLIEISKLHIMYDEALEMLEIIQDALLAEDSRLAGTVFAKDDVLDEINRASTTIIASYIKKNPDQGEEALMIYSIIHKLERIGDHCNNIAEEIIFYIDAKVLKHSKKKDEE